VLYTSGCDVFRKKKNRKAGLSEKGLIIAC
jgi:hypothetical protein